MAGGFVYNVIETPELSTSEIYGKTLAGLAKEHKEIVAVTADLATSTKLQDFTNACPDRVFNVGIAEQNICISGFGCCHCIIDNRCRICSVLAADDLNACTVSPLCQLLSGCRTEGICCSKDDLFSLIL